MPTYDNESWLALKVGASFLTVPLYPTTQWVDPHSMTKAELSGNSGFEAQHVTHEYWQPMIVARAPVYMSWFTAVMLNIGLVTRTQGVLASFPGVAFKHGTGTAKQFSKCNLGGFELQHMGQGRPLLATLMLFPCGAQEAVTAVPALPASSSKPVHGRGATVAGMNNIWGFTFSANNNLFIDEGATITPDTATGKFLPGGYLNGPLDYGFQVTQTLDATNSYDTSQASTATTDHQTPTLAVTDGSATVNLAMRLMNPDRDETLAQSVGLISRAYRNIASGGLPSLSIT